MALVTNVNMLYVYHTAYTPASQLPLMNLSISLSDPHCYGMQELSSASSERAAVRELLGRQADGDAQAEKDVTSNTLYQHLSRGLAYTTGSALGCVPPSTDACLEAFLVTNTAGLTEGARAWTKHFHRSMPVDATSGGNGEGGESGSKKRKKADVEASAGWWGIASGSVATINEKALALFWKVMNGATWRNLHWLPREVVVYEVRVAEGYGMRWSQQQVLELGDLGEKTQTDMTWSFRGFVEPMMENGHEVGWRH